MAKGEHDLINVQAHVGQALHKVVQLCVTTTALVVIRLQLYVPAADDKKPNHVSL